MLVCKEFSHEMGKPCFNFRLTLSKDVEISDTVVTIIINRRFYARDHEQGETVV